MIHRNRDEVTYGVPLGILMVVWGLLILRDHQDNSRPDLVDKYDDKRI